MILRALEQPGGNVTQAARQLKISRKSLQNKLKDFGLRDKSRRLRSRPSVSGSPGPPAWRAPPWAAA